MTKTKLLLESEMSPSMDLSIRQSLCTCFPEDIDIFRKTRAWHGSAPAWSVVVEDGDRVVAHVGLVDRTVKVGNVLVRVAGIQNVLVLPDYRGQGLCDSVMETAMREASKAKCDVGLLFCVPGLEKVYARCGWKSLGCRDVIRIDEHGREVPIPDKNIAMFYPLAVSEFPDGLIHLQGNDW